MPVFFFLLWRHIWHIALFFLVVHTRKETKTIFSTRVCVFIHCCQFSLSVDTLVSRLKKHHKLLFLIAALNVDHSATHFLFYCTHQRVVLLKTF